MMQLIWFLSFLIHLSKSELIHVHVIYRHGDRSPILIYPTDPHQENAWPMGLGALTNVGKNQHFELGKFIRQRYDTLLQKTYNATEFFVRSTDVDRTLMSAESNLAGLYFPDNVNNQFNKLLKWNPVPIHTVPISEDAILYGGQECPRVDQLMQQVFETSEVKAVEKANKEFLDDLQVKTGMLSLNISNLWSVVDTTICEMVHNFSIPSWITKTVYEKMRKLDVYTWNLRFTTLALRRLRGGALLYKVLEHLQDLSRHPTPISYKKGSKMIMYSSHDFTVSDFMNSAHVDNGLLPPYATAVFVELHLIDNKYVVKMYLRNSTDEPPYPLTVAGCSQACPVNQLIDLLSQEILHPDDYKDACKVYKEPNIERDLSFGFSVACIAGVLIMLIMIGIYIIRRTRYRQYRIMKRTKIDDEDI